MIENNPSSDRMRLTLAIVLSVAVTFGYFWFSSQKREAAVKETKTVATENQLKAQNAPAAAFQTQAASAPAASAKKQPEKILSVIEKTLTNSLLSVTLTSTDAAVTSARLAVSTYNPFIYEFEENSLNQYRTGALTFSSSLEETMPSVNWEIIYSDASNIAFKQTFAVNAQSVDIIKRYSLVGYDLKLSVTFANTGKSSAVGSYLLLNGSTMGKKVVHLANTQYDNIFLSYFSGNDFEQVFNEQSDGMFGGSETKKEVPNVRWLSLDNRFHTRILESSSEGSKALFYKRVADGSTNLIGGISASYNLLPQQSSEQKWVFSYLPKSRGLLNDIFDESGRMFFSIYDQTSFFRIIAEWMYFIMLWIFSFVPDWGWAVVILTLLIKIVTWPLNQKAYKSMQKMSDLSPKIKAIGEKHKNNPQQKNAEIMSLYRKEKVNPAGGCIPMLIPIPIFIALYTLFLNMIEMHGQSFFWVKDLTKPDTIAVLPFSIPFLGSDVNILPIVMTLATFLQSAVTPSAQTDENRQMTIMMKYLMPLMFFFICWNMPAALVLFWTLNSLFSFAQTYYVRKTMKPAQTK